jgi:CRP-like cAMP-binding protein
VATLHVVGPGDVVGEMAVIHDGGRRTATVMALEPAETLSLQRDQFIELRREHPAVDRFLIEVLAAHIARADRHLMEALFVPVERRVLRRLLALTDVYGNAGNGSEIPLTQDDLASLAGTSRATVNRVLRQAEEAGWVSLGRGRVKVLDAERLARRSR